jgi:hypothetical protein
LFEKEPLDWIPRFFFKAGVQEAEEDTMSDVHALALAMEFPPPSHRLERQRAEGRFPWLSTKPYYISRFISYWSIKGKLKSFRLTKKPGQPDYST